MIIDIRFNGTQRDLEVPPGIHVGDLLKALDVAEAEYQVLQNGSALPAGRTLQSLGILEGSTLAIQSIQRSTSTVSAGWGVSSNSSQPASSAAPETPLVQKPAPSEPQPVSGWGLPAPTPPPSHTGWDLPSPAASPQSGWDVAPSEKKKSGWEL